MTFDAIGACTGTFDADSGSTLGLFVARLRPIDRTASIWAPIGILLDVAVEFIFEWVFF
jgi:hypothetical protein